MESLTDLPPNILLDILSRLPIKTLLACRSVCKTFLYLTSSNPYFNSLHSSKATQTLIFQLGISFLPTRLLHLLDSELDTSYRFGENVGIKPMFQIPKFPPKYCPKYGFPSGDENKFVLVNSCNGLVFFAEQSFCGRSFICNPITSEYVTLPEYVEEENEKQLSFGLWFGFSEAENQYKVLRIFCSTIGEILDDDFQQEYRAQVHVVGSSLWRDIEGGPPTPFLSWHTISAFFKGTVCWLCRYPEESKILYFNFELERFGEIAPPLAFGINRSYETRIMHNMRIGVLGGYLCLTNKTQHYDIWVMKKFGIQESWTKQFTIDPTKLLCRSLEGPFRPLHMLSDGKIMILWNKETLVCYDPKDKDFRSVEFYGVYSVGKVVPFTPSFVPLLKALMVDNLEVQKMTLEDMAPTEDLKFWMSELNLELKLDLKLEVDLSRRCVCLS